LEIAHLTGEGGGGGEVMFDEITFHEHRPRQFMGIVGEVDPQPEAARRALTEVGDRDACYLRSRIPLAQRRRQERRIDLLQFARERDLFAHVRHSPDTTPDCAGIGSRKSASRGQLVVPRTAKIVPITAYRRAPTRPVKKFFAGTRSRISTAAAASPTSARTPACSHIES